MIGTLNINSLSTKFEQLKLIIANYFGALVVEETELDPSFPTERFMIERYRKPYHGLLEYNITFFAFWYQFWSKYPQNSLFDPHLCPKRALFMS